MMSVVNLIMVAGAAVVFALTMTVLIPRLARDLAQSRLAEVVDDLDRMISKGALPQHDYVMRVRRVIYRCLERPEQMSLGAVFEMLADEELEQAAQGDPVHASFMANATRSEAFLMSEVEQRFAGVFVSAALKNNPTWLPVLALSKVLPRLRRIRESPVKFVREELVHA